MTKRRATVFLGFAILVALFVFDHWMFSKWVGTAYWRWYLMNGTLIGLITPIVFKAWGDLADQHTGLLDPHPFVYLASCLQVIGLPISSLGTQLQSNEGQASWFDYVLTVVWALLLVASILLWFVVVVPAQYAVYFVCGAPVRFMLGSDRVPIATLAGIRVRFDNIDRRDTVPEGWKNVSITNSPVSMTNVLGAFALWHLAGLRQLSHTESSEERPSIDCKPHPLVSYAPVSGLWKCVHRQGAL